MTDIFNKTEFKERRKELRNNSTNAEIVLWKYLQKSQLCGRKFRRQYGIDKFIVDFYCPAERLIIELDGESHFTPEGQKYDAERRGYFESLGLREVRFENQEVLYNIDMVLEKIKECFNKKY